MNIWIKYVVTYCNKTNRPTSCIDQVRNILQTPLYDGLRLRSVVEDCVYFIIIILYQFIIIIIIFFLSKCRTLTFIISIIIYYYYIYCIIIIYYYYMMMYFITINDIQTKTHTDDYLRGMVVGLLTKQIGPTRSFDLNCWASVEAEENVVLRQRRCIEPFLTHRRSNTAPKS